jgi:hypothetical protein
MLEPLGEVAVRMTTRTDAHQTTENKELAFQKTEKVSEERPIENTQKSSNAELDTEQETDGYNLDGRDVFYEKYDKNGNVIIRLPQEKKPIDELV